MTFRLVVEKGRSKGKALRLKPNGVVTIGRDASTTLRLIDAQASRKHVKVEAKLGEFVLEDLDSSNGTFVNGQRVQRHVLQPGDKVQVGDTLIYFLEEATSEDGTTGDRKGELTGQEVDGYRLGRLLGRGGMGTVYEAVQVSLERTVAFKVLARELTRDPALIDRFVAEARAAGRLSHPNIVAVFHVGQARAGAAPIHYYSMEYMPGGSVDDLLTKEGKLSLQRSIPVVFDAARGLEYAERQGLVHRDIKPGNLMLGADEVTKIADLGLATWQPGAQEACGSPHYVAPEQALGKPVDHRADLYALGVTWYHMLAGDTPFTGQSAREVLLKQIHEAAPPILERVPDLPPEAAALVHRLLEKDPAKRVQTARQLQADLAELARRYPPRETVLLRIDAAAPEDPPSEELGPGGDADPSRAQTSTNAQPAAEEAQGARGLLRWAGLLAAAVGLMAVAFGGTLAVGKALGGRRDAALRAADDELAKLRARVQRDDPAARLEAEALERDLLARGLEQKAAEARALVGEVDAREARRFEQGAAQRLAAIEQVLATRGQGPDEDPTIGAALAGVQAELRKLIVDAPKAQVAPRAGELLAVVDRRLAAGEEVRRAQAARDQASREAFVEAEREIGALLRSEERRDRFAAAKARAEAYHAAHGRPGTVGESLAVKLHDHVRERAARAVTALVERARQAALNQAYQEARAALDEAPAPLGFPELERSVQEARDLVDATERAVAEADAAQRAKEARAARAKALDAVLQAVAQRRFADAASSLEVDAALVRDPAVRRHLELRAGRLAGAARALDRLAEHVRQGGRKLRTTLAMPGSPEGTATAVDKAGRVFFFEIRAGVGKDLDLDRCDWDQLARFLDAVGLDAAGRVDAACLAFELEARGPAQERLLALRTAAGVQADAALEARVKALDDLAADEAR